MPCVGVPGIGVNGKVGVIELVVLCIGGESIRPFREDATPGVDGKPCVDSAIKGAMLPGGL